MITEETVKATLVPCEDRMDFLPNFFGFNLMLIGEGLIYQWMDRLSEDYNGGYWHFYTLDNGGFYMAPAIDSEMQVVVSGNYYEGKVSADAAGIIATMFALGQIASEFPDQEQFIDLYHLLRGFIHDHPESDEIFKALD